MDEKEAEARPVMGTIFLVISCNEDQTVRFHLSNDFFFFGASAIL